MSNLIPAIAIAGSAFLASPAFAQEPNPYHAPNATWLSLEGTVTEVGSDTFTMDYGPARVAVEMDDSVFDSAAYQLDSGERVRVTGVVDDDLFETTTIEAASVFVEDANTWFYSPSSADEEDSFVTNTMPVEVSDVLVQGTVNSVDPNDDEFVVEAGVQDIRVETEELAYNPLDQAGFQQVDVGDRVSVAGEVDVDFFEGQTELVANSVVTLAE